jgi:DNA (cytosine-5)-methyltransferase 1
MNYYNEFDRKTASWLRALIAAKIIPEGKVDERSIKEVSGNELVGFSQCHFFAGIAGWSRALQLANWDSGRQVWTGSCPCQPLSSAGKRGGEKDERHLWPEFYRLISECRPTTVFGEQVASKDGIEWLDGISLDLEELDYRFAASDLPSAGVGSPNIRQRGYWVANAIGSNEQQREKDKWQTQPARRASPCRLAYPRHSTAESASGVSSGVENPELPSGARLGRELWEGIRDQETGGLVRPSTDGFWSNSIWHPCSDGKIRRIPVEPAFFPLAPRIPGRVAMLRGFGNAINPELASQFIQAFLEAETDLTLT